jgi:nucleoside-diphosphate-sugar epimerase
MVLSVNGMDGMQTCVLRPGNLFGPGDSSLLRFIAGYGRSPLGKVLHTEIFLFPFSLLSQCTTLFIYFLLGRICI